MDRELRAILRDVIRCPLCHRSGGHIADGADFCGRCMAEFDPAPLRFWSDCVGFDAQWIGEMTGLSRATIARAMAGRRIGRRSAEALSKLTRIPVADLREKVRKT